MRNIRLFILPLIVITTFCLNSCENEPLESSLLSETNNGGGTGGGTSTNYYFRVTKDGGVKQWSTIQAVNTSVLNSFIFTAADSSTSMSLILFDVSNIGIYNLSFAEKSCIYTEGTNIFSSDYSDFNTSAGNITITELNKTNKTIKGTFNFIGKNQAMTATKVFTKGEFYTTYTVQ